MPQPQYLGALVKLFNDKPNDEPIFGGFVAKIREAYPDIDERFEAYFYALLIIITSALNVLCVHAYMLHQIHLGLKLRVAMCSVIYRKSLRLSKAALGETTVGQIVNLLTNDVGRFDQAMLFIQYLVIGPIETIVITYLMYQEVIFFKSFSDIVNSITSIFFQIELSAIFGVIFMFLFIPLEAYFGRKTSELRMRTALITDKRIRLMNEIIQGIQVIKMYACEKPFGKMIAQTRISELRVIKYASYIRGALLSFNVFTTRVSIFVSLVAYALLNNYVSSEKAFIITAYYNILRNTMTVFFPRAVSQLVL